MKKNEPKYRPLETEYTKHGYLFRQVKREGLVAMYEQLDVQETGQEILICHEVYEVIQMEAGFAGPQKYPQPAREVPPGNEQWGMKGFSPTTRERADIRFEELKNRLVNRDKNREIIAKKTKKDARKGSK